jgi:hypothetical protein
MKVSTRGWIFGLLIVLCTVLPLQGMLAKKATRSLGTSIHPEQGRTPPVNTPSPPINIPDSPFGPKGQKRTIYSPERLKNLYEPLTPQAQVVAPLHGAIEFETGAVQKRYSVESEAFGPQLVQELFHEQGPQFKPTASKSKAAYALSPEIVGLVIGALETGKLQDQGVRDYIIGQWVNEYRRLTDEKKPFSKGKIEKLLTLIEGEYNNDKESCRRILLGFLYAKALPDNDHDMIHYLAGLNEFMPVFVESHHPMAEAVENYTTQKKNKLPYEDKSIFAQLKAAMYAMKNYIMGTPSTYTPENYEFTKWKVKKTSPAEALKEATTKDFEVTVSTMLDDLRTGRSPYPSKVIQSRYGYRGNAPAPDCVETTIHDLLNILLYNPQLKAFDLSLLPSGLSLNEKFKQFYTDYSSVGKINTHECGQAFMNLVSGVPGVSYIRWDYELKAGDSEKNLLTLANYFFGINAQNLNELGTKLSDERRAINFTVQAGNPTSTITMNIRNKKTNERWQADFCFTSGHGWAQVPGRDTQGLKKELFTRQELTRNYGVSPRAQVLFRIEPDLSALLSQYPRYQPPTSLFYAAPVETDGQRADAIKHMMSAGKNVNRETIDYALTLLEQMEAPSKSIYNIIEAGVASGLWRSDKKLKELVVRNPTIFLDKVARVGSREQFINDIKELYQALPHVIVKQLFIRELVRGFMTSTQSFDKDFEIKMHEQILDFIKSVYKEMSDVSSKQQYIIDVLKMIINTRLCTTNFIMGLYEQITDETYKKKFLADFLCIRIDEPLPKIDWPQHPGHSVGEWARREYHQKYDEKSKERSYYQDLRKAIDLVAIAKRCIADGADIVGSATITYSKDSTTPLCSAIRLNNPSLVELLIDNGSPIDVPIRWKNYNTTPLGIAVYHINAIAELLLKHGADPNGSYIDMRNNITYPIIFADFYSVDKLKMLIQYGADVNSRNSKQETLLDVLNRSQGGSIEEQKKVLIAAGAKTSKQLSEEQVVKQPVEVSQEQVTEKPIENKPVIEAPQEQTIEQPVIENQPVEDVVARGQFNQLNRE